MYKLFPILFTGFFAVACAPAMAQVAYQYCYAASPVRSTGSLLFSVSHFDENDITQTIFTVTDRNKRPLTGSGVRFSLNSPGGEQVLDMKTDANGNARLTYNPFANRGDSLVVYASVDARTYAGPVYLYRFVKGRPSALQQACAERNRPVSVINQLKDSAVFSKNLIDRRIAPNAGTKALCRALNYGVLDSATVPADYKWVYPSFSRPSASRRKLFRKEYKKDKKPDKALAAVLEQSTRTLHGVIDSVYQHNRAATALETEVKNNLYALDRLLSATLVRKNRINRATLVQVNQQLQLIMKFLRRPGLGSQLESINWVEGDLAHLVGPYATSRSLLGLGGKADRGPGTVSLGGLAPAEVEPAQPMPDDDNSDPSLRRFHFYLFRLVWVDTVINGNRQKAPRAIYNTPDMQDLYEVYCVPEGIYKLYQAKKIALDELSDYRSSSKASIGSKNLRLAPYYFFVVLSGDPANKPASIVDRFNTGEIDRSNGSFFMTLPYSFAIQLK